MFISSSIHRAFALRASLFHCDIFSNFICYCRRPKLKKSLFQNEYQHIPNTQVKYRILSYILINSNHTHITGLHRQAQICFGGGRNGKPMLINRRQSVTNFFVLLRLRSHVFYICYTLERTVTLSTCIIICFNKKILIQFIIKYCYTLDFSYFQGPQQPSG